MTTETPSAARIAPIDSDRLQDLLIKTSRTFALAIPELPQPTRLEVTIAYLLFRIADTFEDATVQWPSDRQIEELECFAKLMEAPEPAAAVELSQRWLREAPSDHEGYLELLKETPGVLASLRELSVPAQKIIAEHTARTARGMADFVRLSVERGGLELSSVDELRHYCYVVAGIVGEMLAELFLLDRAHLDPIATTLREKAGAFGEGLQLVNILKDSASDADEGRRFLPAANERAEIFRLAREDLDSAVDYCLEIQRMGGPMEIVAFTALPVELARLTLDRVERDGPGSKITRPEVFAMYERLHRALAEGRPAIER